MKKSKLSKISRILVIYYLLLDCQEVTLEELAPIKCCKKTIQRDIAFIRQAGAEIRFNKVQKAYIMPCKTLKDIEKQENKAQERWLHRLQRLMLALQEMPEEDCDIWYRERFPLKSKRTMQRDFAELNKLGFEIHYERDLLTLGYDEDEPHPRGQYIRCYLDSFTVLDAVCSS